MKANWLSLMVLGGLAAMAGCSGDPNIGNSARIERVAIAQDALCSGATLALSPNVGVPNASVTATATASCITTMPEYEFWIEDPSGNWTAPAGWGTSPTYQWTVPAGATDGQVYNWQVWAREAGSSAQYETYAAASFTVATASCTNATANISQMSGGQGTSVTISGGATCASPQFEYWVRDLSGNWTSPTGWTSSSSYQWTVPAGGSDGQVYYWQVWAREAGANTTYDTWAGTSFTLQTPCSGGTLDVSPAAGSATTSVTLTGGATCTGTAQYSFWARDPTSGNWTSPSGWISSNTYQWTVPSGATDGQVYDLQVWVRDTDALYDTYAASTFSVVAACSGATMGFNPGGGVAGDSIQVTASASCALANPQYEFWVEDPTSGTWSSPGGWGTSSTYQWTVPAGATNGQIYNWQAWARESGSTASYETYAAAAFTVGPVPTPCTGGSAQVSPETGSAGSSVQITGSATCSGTAQYEVWILDPTSGTWSSPTGWTGSSTYQWTVPVGATSGQVYNVQVWERDTTALYDTYGADSFTVQ
jgi:hypothetical protein